MWFKKCGIEVWIETVQSKIHVAYDWILCRNKNINGFPNNSDQKAKDDHDERRGDK